MSAGGAAPTFLGLPRSRPVDVGEVDVAILGVPRGIPYPGRAGTRSADAPAAIRAASQRFAPFLAHHDFDFDGPILGEPPLRVVDCGDVDIGDAGAGDTGPITDAVARLLRAGAVPLVLGGDDSVPIPVLRAYAGAEPMVVVHVDAHLDFRDEVDGVRDGYSSPMRRASEMPWVERIVDVGLRGVGSAREGDVADAVAAGNRLVTAREVHQLGVETVLDELPDEARVFISLDCDGLDPTVLPGVNAPLPGGVTFEEASELLRRLATRTRVVGAAITELVPAADVNGISSIVAVRLLATLIGGFARNRAAA